MDFKFFINRACDVKILQQTFSRSKTAALRDSRFRIEYREGSGRFAPPPGKAETHKAQSQQT